MNRIDYARQLTHEARELMKLINSCDDLVAIEEFTEELDDVLMELKRQKQYITGGHI
jgi:hypothetical protein